MLITTWWFWARPWARLRSPSNETIVIGTGFGNDTVVNFAVAGNGQDYFDFTALKGTTLTA